MTADIKDGFCVFDDGLGDAVFLLDEDFVVEGLLVFPELGRGSWHGSCLVKAVERLRGLWSWMVVTGLLFSLIQGHGIWCYKR